ncbi:MAG: response regulator transcription factor [Catenulispora sp.]|nr:response regulator transcription factor [Catenulispora sp.]
MRLLLVEDDDRVLAALRDGLLRHGFLVSCARTGAEAVALATAPAGPAPEAILLDLGLPDQDGFKVCEQIRRHCDAPIIMATARADVRSRVHGLNLGADDYVVKPYNLAELIARIHAVTRRGRTAAGGPATPARPAPHLLGVGPLRVDTAGRTVQVSGYPVALARKEFDLLALLARRPGVVFRREQILSEIWNSAWDGTGRTLEVHIASLRGKLGVPDLIETVRGVGYRLRGG